MRRIDLERAHVWRPNTVRDINRQIVLNYVREQGPTSQAEIARATKLKRSTISIILDELKADGLVEEVGFGESTGGRPPNLLRLRAAGATAIGVDIRRARTTVATSDLAGRVLERVELSTDPRAEAMIERVIDHVCDMARKSGSLIEGVGISVPGLVDFPTGRATYVPYYNWRDLDLGRQISSVTGLSVTVENNANAAALAELWFGRPEVSKVRDFIMLLVYDGVGAGIVFDGQL